MLKRILSSTDRTDINTLLIFFFNIQSKMASERSQFEGMILGNQSFTNRSVYINWFKISFNMVFHLARGGRG